MAPNDAAPRGPEHSARKPRKPRTPVAPTPQAQSATRDQADQLREQTRLLWATVAGFVLGAIGGAAVLHGGPRPFAGAGGATVPIALIAAALAAAAFIASTRLHRAHETTPMPPWQTAVSHLSAAAVTIALAAVTGLGVLLTGQVLETSLQGLALQTSGGAVLAGVAAALGARFAFRAGAALTATDLVGLLAAFLVIGTFLAMVTATEPDWWRRNFSQLGMGPGGWAFNGTLIVAGLLIATVGSYIGRDLHRLLGDRALARIAPAVLAWALAGTALAAVGLLPLNRAPVPHLIAAFAAAALVAIAAGFSLRAVPDPPRVLLAATGGFIVLVVAVVGAALLFHLPMAAVEGVVVGLAILWLTTFVRVLGILSPSVSMPSAVRHLIR
ncbi:DUF998 domain-containing protein [Leucobacter sp. HY1910]